jgi:predicted transcriptional regulator of viral defense system
MKKLINLPKELSKQPFTYKMAKKNKIGKNVLARFIREGKVEKIYRGIYASNKLERNINFYFTCASLSFSEDSIICLISALVYYELTDLVGRKIWVMVSDKTRTTRKWLKIIRNRNLDTKTGVIQKKGFKITSIERTIVDAFKYKEIVGLKTASNAYKTAIKNKKTTGLKVLQMSKKLKAENKIKNFLEIM